MQLKHSVVFLDSGVGGLPYLEHFAKIAPRSKLCYIADREGFPYGSKTKTELEVCLINLVERIIAKIEPELIVLACNTASVSALSALRERFSPLPFVGTVPAVRPAALGSKSGVIGVLGTARTVEDGYISRLAGEAGRDGGLRVIPRAAPMLVDFVEKQFLDSSPVERLDIARRYAGEFRKAGADGLVLGCTHFLFLRDEFCAAAQPDITIYDSLEGVCQRAASFAGEGAQDYHILSCDFDAYKGNYELNAENVRTFILKNLRNDYVIEATGEKLFITEKGAKKMAGAGLLEKKIVMYVPQLIKNAVFAAELPAYKIKSTFSMFKYYWVILNNGIDEYLARLVTGKNKKGKFEYYEHILYPIKKGSENSTTLAGRKTPPYSHPWLNTSLTHKDNTIKKIMQELLPPLLVTGGAPLEEKWTRWAKRFGLQALLFNEAAQ